MNPVRSWENRKFEPNESKNVARKLMDFLKEDSWQSWIVSLILLVILIRFVFFPLLSLVTNGPLPLVVIESCSMYHEYDLKEWWSLNEDWYSSKNITEKKFESFSFKNGLNKGDVIFVWSRSEPELGDVVIFEPNPEASAQHPIIHRIISTAPYATKGDHNFQQLTKLLFREKK